MELSASWFFHSLVLRQFLPFSSQSEEREKKINCPTPKADTEFQASLTLVLRKKDQKYLEKYFKNIFLFLPMKVLKFRQFLIIHLFSILIESGQDTNIFNWKLQKNVQVYEAVKNIWFCVGKNWKKNSLIVTYANVKHTYTHTHANTHTLTHTLTHSHTHTHTHAHTYKHTTHTNLHTQMKTQIRTPHTHTHTYT